MKSINEKVSMLTITEARKVLRCSRGFLYSLRRAGKLQAVKAGRKVLVSKSAIYEYLAANQEGHNQ